MTAQARITQADFERATKVATSAVRKHGAGVARVIFRLEAKEIEIIVGGSGEATPSERNPFDED